MESKVVAIVRYLKQEQKPMLVQGTAGCGPICSNRGTDSFLHLGARSKSCLKFASFQTVKVSVLIATMDTRIGPALLSEVIGDITAALFSILPISDLALVWLDHPCLVLASGICPISKTGERE